MAAPGTAAAEVTPQPYATNDAGGFRNVLPAGEGGLDNATNPRARQNLSNGKGIDHLGENAAIGTVIGANIGTAIGMCS